MTARISVEFVYQRCVQTVEAQKEESHLLDVELPVALMLWRHIQTLRVQEEKETHQLHLLEKGKICRDRTVSILS